MLEARGLHGEWSKTIIRKVRSKHLAIDRFNTRRLHAKRRCEPAETRPGWRGAAQRKGTGCPRSCRGGAWMCDAARPYASLRAPFSRARPCQAPAAAPSLLVFECDLESIFRRLSVSRGNERSEERGTGMSSVWLHISQTNLWSRATRLVHQESTRSCRQLQVAKISPRPPMVYRTHHSQQSGISRLTLFCDSLRRMFVLCGMEVYLLASKQRLW